METCSHVVSPSTPHFPTFVHRMPTCQAHREFPGDSICFLFVSIFKIVPIMSWIYRPCYTSGCSFSNKTGASCFLGEVICCSSYIHSVVEMSSPQLSSVLTGGGGAILSEKQGFDVALPLWTFTYLYLTLACNLVWVFFFLHQHTPQMKFKICFCQLFMHCSHEYHRSVWDM